MVNTLVLVLVAAIALLAVYAATRPDHFRIQRTTVINAPAARIYPLINDLRSFNGWNPFEKSDPSATGNYSGAASGVGAAYAWKGKKIGVGRMEITATQAPSAVTMRLDFLKPMKALNTAEFTLESHGEATTAVTWAMHGPSPYLSKLMGLFMSMDRMVGGAFETGLADLKRLLEVR